ILCYVYLSFFGRTLNDRLATGAKRARICAAVDHRAEKTRKRTLKMHKLANRPEIHFQPSDTLFSSPCSPARPGLFPGSLYPHASLAFFWIVLMLAGSTVLVGDSTAYSGAKWDFLNAKKVLAAAA